MDIRKLVSDAVGRAFKGGWLERKLHGGIQDALANSIESTVADAGSTVRGTMQAVRGYREQLPPEQREALHGIDLERAIAENESRTPGQSEYRFDLARILDEASDELQRSALERLGQLMDDWAESSMIRRTATMLPDPIESLGRGPVADALASLHREPVAAVPPPDPIQAPRQEDAQATTATVNTQSIGRWDRFLSLLAGLRRNAEQQPQIQSPQNEDRSRPNRARQSIEPGTVIPAVIQIDMDPLQKSIDRTGDVIGRALDNVHDVLRGLSMNVNINTVTQQATGQPASQPRSQSTTQPQGRRGSGGSGNNRPNRNSRRRRQSGSRGRWTRTFMNRRFTRRGQAATVRFGRNMGRRVAGFFGRSGAAGARMGGRVAAGLARFAGPTAMGIAGAAGSMGPAIIGIAVAGKVLGIVGAVAGVVAVALNKLADSAIAATVRISKYDARLASAGAMLEVGRTMRDIRMAQATGKSGSELLRAQDRFEQKAQPFREELQNISNEIATAWLELKGDFVEAAIPILKFMKDNVAEGFEMVQAALGTIQATIDAIPLLGTYLKLMRDDAADRRKDAQWAARLKERMDRQANAAAVFNNMQQMLDAAARRAPF
jgi:hypothetical protein